MKSIYRTDIDTLRAVSVIAVILFHLGFISNGYLGVDVFFVISGYLITGIVFNETQNGEFSILKFYERRIRRIFPLVILITIIAFCLGCIFMLPDDLENLCQSIIASNFSGNNILMKITSEDYWALKNDFKPLMHTWSLGIEEQFYLIFPLIFYFFNGTRLKYIVPVLISLTIISLFLFLNSTNSSAKFYYIQYRFFELSIGGLAAIYFRKENNLIKSQLGHFGAIFGLILLISIMSFQIPLGNDSKILITTVLTTIVLVFGSFHFSVDGLYRKISTTKVITFFGKISFSLYMWHQLIFAFSRYLFVEEFSFQNSVIAILIVFLFSTLSYYFIENPFRNKSLISRKSLFIIVITTFFIVNSAALYVYFIGGIVKDVPELELYTENKREINFFNSQDNIHIKYNEDFRKFNKPFMGIKRLKILILGDSYARDFGNILNESSFKEEIELYYLSSIPVNRDSIFEASDIIFYATSQLIDKNNITKLISRQTSISKLWIVGIKDFGISNGIFYNKLGNTECFKIRTKLKKGILQINDVQATQWSNRYINLISLIIDDNKTVPVFTSSCKFISQDTEHLTKSGAMYFSELLENQFKEILK
jgi:peptidoglycan/LPS O-acetylase OafA/YrhL